MFCLISIIWLWHVSVPCSLYTYIPLSQSLSQPLVCSTKERDLWKRAMWSPPTPRTHQGLFSASIRRLPETPCGSVILVLLRHFFLWLFLTWTDLGPRLPRITLFLCSNGRWWLSRQICPRSVPVPDEREQAMSPSQPLFQCTMLITLPTFFIIIICSRCVRLKSFWK